MIRQEPEHLVFAPCMGLESTLSFVLLIIEAFAPCMGLERVVSSNVIVKKEFAPCMGLESL